MLFVFAALLGGGVAVLRGGRLSNLADYSIRWSALPLLALGLQIYVVYGPAKEDARLFGIPALLNLASYGLVLATALINWRLPGMAWLGLGASLNFLVILVNGGWMPVTAESLAAAGLVMSSSAVMLGERAIPSKDLIKDSHDIRLRWLSDRYVIPEAGLFSAVYSVGDIFLMFGLFRLIQAGMMNRSEHISQIARSSPGTNPPFTHKDKLV